MSATSMCDGLGQAHEFMLRLKKAGFNDDLIQRVVTSRGNKLAQAMYAAIASSEEVDDPFELVNTFNVVVPEGYDHITCLTTFQKNHRSEFAFFNEAITDVNFSRATTQLVPGRKFRVKAFQIKRTVSSADCLTKIRAERGILVGAQGASLVYKQARAELPVGRLSLSFDEKEALPIVDGDHRVPCVDRRSKDCFGWYLYVFERDWYASYVLLVFRPVF